MRTRPSKPWSMLWLESVVQASQPMLRDPGRDLGRRREDRVAREVLVVRCANGTSSWQIARSALCTIGLIAANIGSKSKRSLPARRRRPRARSPIRCCARAGRRSSARCPAVPLSVRSRSCRGRASGSGGTAAGGSAGGRRRVVDEVTVIASRASGGRARRPGAGDRKTSHRAGPGHAAEHSVTGCVSPTRPPSGCAARLRRVERIVAWPPVKCPRPVGARRRAGGAGGDDARSEPPLDVLVVGGGVVGTGAALDAVTRGLTVGLLEQRDLASGTSVAVEQADPRRPALPGDVRLRRWSARRWRSAACCSPGSRRTWSGRCRSSTRCTAPSSGPTSAPGSRCTTRWRWPASTTWACPSTSTCSASRSPGSRPTCAPTQLHRRDPLLRLPGRRRAAGGDPRPHRRPPRRP